MEDFSLEDLQAALQSAQDEKSAVSERNSASCFVWFYPSLCCDGRQASTQGDCRPSCRIGT